MVSRDHGDFVYAGDAKIANGIITLTEDEWSHLTRVRRGREGEEVFASDGWGIVYRCRIDKDRKLQVTEELPGFGELPVRLTLICGMLQGDSARDVTTAAVPLGVREIFWTRMERSQESYSEAKLEKLKRVAIQSLKQCGRACLPEQSCVRNLEEALARTVSPVTWIAQMGADDAQLVETTSGDSFTLIIGPEGGFTDHELRLATNHGARLLHLGNRRLRSELAVAVGLSTLLARSRPD